MNTKPPLVVAVSSQKGGVGKTTTCVSLAASLAEAGQSVLAIDLDPQGHLTQALGVDPEGLRRTVGDVLLYQATLMEVSRETSIPNLDLLPANRGLILVERLLHTTSAASSGASPSAPLPAGEPPPGILPASTGASPALPSASARRYEYRLRTALASLRSGYYDVILLDCPPSFGPLAINGLACADLAIIPVTCDYFSMHSLQVFLQLLDLLRQGAPNRPPLNPGLQVRILITLFDARTRLSRMFLDQYRQKFGPNLFNAIIPMDAKLRESALFCRPITEYASASRSAQEYRALAMELQQCS